MMHRSNNDAPSSPLKRIRDNKLLSCPLFRTTLDIDAPLSPTNVYIAPITTHDAPSALYATLSFFARHTLGGDVTMNAKLNMMGPKHWKGLGPMNQLTSPLLSLFVRSKHPDSNAHIATSSRVIGSPSQPRKMFFDVSSLSNTFTTKSAASS